MESFSQTSSGFLNLLSTQMSQTTDRDSPELPRFSTQSPEEPKSVEKRRWTVKEDLVLISAWLNTSKDPIVGNEQRAGSFWKRIEAYVNGSPQTNDLPPREWSQCKQRWGRVIGEVCKFVGCYEAALKMQSSGQNEDDVIKAAHDIFFNDHQTKFNLEHCWRELRFDQKWRSNSLPKDGAKEKRKESVENVPDQEEERPPGVKAAKAAKKAKKSGNETAFDRLEAIGNQKILQRLLAKKEPLSEMEVTLKDKIISSLLK